MKKFLLFDPVSAVLPFNFFFCEYYFDGEVEVDIICSETEYNSQFIDHWRYGDRFTFKISRTTNRTPVVRLLNYLIAWILVFRSAKKYEEIYISFPSLFLLDLIFLLGLKIRGIRVCWIIHNATEHENERTSRELGKQILLFAVSSVITVSRYTEERLRDLYKLPSALVMRSSEHPPIGFSPEGESFVVSYDHERESENVVVLWGNIKPYKGLETFLKIASYAESTNENMSFLIAGKVDKILRNSIDVYSGANLTLRDGFLSPDELRSLFSKKLICLLPYERASQSGVLHTFAYYGIPFLCSDVGDFKEVCERYNTEDSLLIELAEDSVVNSLRTIFNSYESVRSTRIKIAESVRSRDHTSNTLRQTRD